MEPKVSMPHLQNSALGPSSEPFESRVIETRRMKWIEHVASMRDVRNVYKILVLKHEETTWKTLA